MYKSYEYCYVFKKEVIGHVFQINDKNRYNPVSYFKKNGAVLKFSKVGQRSRSRSCDQRICYHKKGLDVRSTFAKYESLMPYGKKVMWRDKVVQM